MSTHFLPDQDQLHSQDRKPLLGMLAMFSFAALVWVALVMAVLVVS